MYCHQCGNELDEQSKFCPACGAKRLDQEETAAISEDIQESFGETSQSAAKEPSEAQASKPKRPLYLAIGGGILAVILIVTLILALGGKGKDEAAEPTAAATNMANRDVDYFEYFDLSAGQFIRETGLELTFQDGSNLYSGYDGKIELSNGEEGIDYFKMATAIGKGSILGVSVGMSKDEAATALQKNGLYEVKTENNHTTYKEQNGSYTLDVGISVNDSKVNSVTYALENGDDDEASDKDQTCLLYTSDAADEL